MKKIFKYTVLSLSIIGCTITFATNVNAQSKKIVNATRIISDVRVTISQVSTTSTNEGKVLLVGDCALCDQEFSFNADTLLRTPFFQGDLELEVLEEQKFAEATVTVNTYSQEVLAINYMGLEY